MLRSGNKRRQGPCEKSHELHYIRKPPLSLYQCIRKNSPVRRPASEWRELFSRRLGSKGRRGAGRQWALRRMKSRHNAQPHTWLRSYKRSLPYPLLMRPIFLLSAVCLFMHSRLYIFLGAIDNRIFYMRETGRKKRKLVCSFVGWTQINFSAFEQTNSIILSYLLNWMLSTQWKHGCIGSCTNCKLGNVCTINNRHKARVDTRLNLYTPNQFFCDMKKVIFKQEHVLSSRSGTSCACNLNPFMNCYADFLFNRLTVLWQTCQRNVDIQINLVKVVAHRQTIANY